MKELMIMYHPVKKEIRFFTRFKGDFVEIPYEECPHLEKYSPGSGEFLLQNQGISFFDDIWEQFARDNVNLTFKGTKIDYEDFRKKVADYNDEKGKEIFKIADYVELPNVSEIYEAISKFCDEALESFDEQLQNQETKQMFRLLPIQVLLSAVGAVNGIVSGYFASNYVGVDAMSAVGLYGPINMLVISLGMLMVSGSVIICGKYMGKNQPDKVQNVFSLNLLLSALVGAVFAVLLLTCGLFDLSGFLTKDPAVRPLLNRYLIGQAIGVFPLVLGTQLPAFLAAKDVESALPLYQALDGYADAREKWISCAVTLATRHYKKKDYASAIALLDALPEQTSESETLRTRSIDRAARAAAKEGAYEEAIALIARIPDYRDDANLLRSWKYTLAESWMKAERWEDVIPLLEELGSYRNAARWLEQAREALATPAAEEDADGN